MITMIIVNLCRIDCLARHDTACALGFQDPRLHWDLHTLRSYKLTKIHFCHGMDYLSHALFSFHSLSQFVQHTLASQEFVSYIFVMQSRLVFCPVTGKIQLTIASKSLNSSRVCQWWSQQKHISIAFARLNSKADGTREWWLHRPKVCNQLNLQ